MGVGGIPGRENKMWEGTDVNSLEPVSPAALCHQMDRAQKGRPGHLSCLWLQGGCEFKSRLKVWPGSLKWATRHLVSAHVRGTFTASGGESTACMQVSL